MGILKPRPLKCHDLSWPLTSHHSIQPTRSINLLATINLRTSDYISGNATSHRILSVWNPSVSNSPTLQQDRLIIYQKSFTVRERVQMFNIVLSGKKSFFLFLSIFARGLYRLTRFRDWPFYLLIIYSFSPDFVFFHIFFRYFGI